MGLKSSQIAGCFMLVVLAANLRESSATICSFHHEVLNATSGSLKSPNFPSHYPHNTTKVWKIIAPQGERITLQFHTFKLQAHSSQCKVQCGCDYVKVRNNCNDVTPAETLCGSVVPFTLTSTGNELWVEFRSDHSSKETGFLALYTSASMSCPRQSDKQADSDYCLNNDTKVQCCDRNYVNCRYNNLLTNLNGTIRSPGYPAIKYPSSTTYRWRITAPQGYVVQINFTTFQIEGKAGCSDCCDKVSVSDGPCDFYAGYTICGSFKAPKLPSYITKGRHLFVDFKSNAVNNFAGFEANYRRALQCSGQKPISCITEGKPSCCSLEDAAVACSGTSALQRSHCPQKKKCCTVDSKPKCCMGRELKPWSLMVIIMAALLMVLQVSK